MTASVEAHWQHRAKNTINDSAVGTDQSVKYVLRVTRDNTIEYRPVTLGPLVGGLRVVRDGLTPEDTIVVNGLQRVRQGSKVEVKTVPMPGAESSPQTPADTAEKTPAANTPVKAAKGG